MNVNHRLSVLQRGGVGGCFWPVVNLLLWPYVPLGAIRNYDDDDDESTYCIKQGVFCWFWHHNISLRAGSHLGTHARAAKSEFKT